MRPVNRAKGRSDSLKRNIGAAVYAVSIALLLLCEFYGKAKFSELFDETTSQLVYMTLTRLLGGAIFVTLTLYLGYKVMNPVRIKAKELAFTVPAFAVVINNLPIIPLISGEAEINASDLQIFLLAAECLAIGLFEETAFRGVVLLGIMEKRRNGTKDLFVSIVLSSAVFGIIHLVNLFTSSPGAVFLQIGYSFLIGAMCAVVLIRTANIWLCVVLHAVYDFCGSLVPTFGDVVIWTAPEVLLTVVISLAAAVYFIIALIKTDVRCIDRIYIKESGKKETQL